MTFCAYGFILQFPVIQVQDKDDGENGVGGILFTLEGYGSGTTFKINENTGIIKVNNGSLIDRETKSDYNLTVRLIIHILYILKLYWNTEL